MDVSSSGYPHFFLLVALHCVHQFSPGDGQKL
jgi:hypothetical protein